ncbi:unnamed protein product [Scytosiphon promiscuus]
MFRHQADKHNRLATLVDSRARAVADALSRRQDKMAEAWKDVDKGWEELERSAAELGIRKASPPDEDIMCLNVGGLRVTFRRSVFQNKNEIFPTGTLAKLFMGGDWDARVPRDADGLIVIDESPACVRHLIHTFTIKGSRAASSSRALSESLPADEKPYLPHVSRALGLSKAPPVSTLTVFGGSTILDPEELGTVLQKWFLSNDNMELIYRASRDGWTPEDFHARCNDDSPSTITLCRVMDHLTGRSCSIVGGFSSVPWTPPGTDGDYAYSEDAFLFMLKHGLATKADSYAPIRWEIDDEDAAVFLSPKGLPHFGGGDLSLVGPPYPYIQTGCESYTIAANAPILLLNGRKLLEIEVFRLSTGKPAVPPPAKRARTKMPDLIDSALCPANSMSAEEADDDVSKFGADVAGALLEQRMALDAAREELRLAARTVGTSVAALAEIYGPDVADGVADPVVELNVGGTRMTTLLSTLQACPDSALAARFDAAKWPATEKDVDADGRRLMECSPSVFSKVLDVLRMRKRAAWAGDDPQQGWGQPVRVGIKAVERTAFEQFVEMYFPGRQSFIMDCVESRQESKAPPRA